MRVLENEAIQDPTKLEASVRQQVADREAKHIADNAARKLTDEQRREKKRKKMEQDSAGLVQVAVFK